MNIDDIVVSKLIFDRFAEKFKDSMEVDVAIAGAGPAGLTAARYLAKAGKKVVIFERKLSPGGGMWGGGMTFPTIAGLHVDPLSVRARYCIDATGHAAEVCRIVQRKVGKLNTPSGKIEEEKSMCAEIGEQTVVENTGEVYPGLFVTGMAANAVYGAPRMGPIFGGMLLSGKKAAEMILKKL